MTKTTFGLPKKREEIINLLQQAYVERDLEEDDYEERLRLAMQAKSLEELQAVVADFPNQPQLLSARPQVQQGRGMAPVPGAQPSAMAIPDGPYRRTQAILTEQRTNLSDAINRPIKITTLLGSHTIDFSHASIVGNMLYISVEAGLGETVIDLRSPDFYQKQVQISLVNVLGEVRIYLPKGVQLHNQLNAILADVSQRKRGVNWLKNMLSRRKEESEPIPFSLTVYGSCILGEVRFVYE